MSQIFMGVLDYMASNEPSTLERHAQTAIGTIVVALMLWAGSSLSALKSDYARSQAQIQAILTAMEKDGGIYTINQASRDWSTVRSNINNLDMRVRRLEARLNGSN